MRSAEKAPSGFIAKVRAPRTIHVYVPPSVRSVRMPTAGMHAFSIRLSMVLIDKWRSRQVLFFASDVLLSSRDWTEGRHSPRNSRAIPPSVRLQGRERGVVGLHLAEGALASIGKRPQKLL